MITLGIETSCDETSVALLRGGDEILSNVVYSSLEEHRPYGGIVPEIASRSHLETVLPCLKMALKKARVGARRGVSVDEIDLVAVTNGPGLMGSILVGLSAAKALAFALKKPLVGVDHVLAHAYSAFLSEPGLRFPCIGLVVSGGHTLLLKMEGAARMRALGTTLDDAAGEAFDKVAKILGLEYPGGPEVDRLARGQDTRRFFFSRPFLSQDSLDFSFSGIKTAVFYEAQRLRKAKALTSAAKKGVCAGFQEALVDVLVEKSLRALRRHGLKTLIVGGGVSANSRLRLKMTSAAQKENVRAVFPPMSLCRDNAAMIAALGRALYRTGRRDKLDLTAYADFESAVIARNLPAGSAKRRSSDR